MKILDANTPWKDRAYYFCGKLPASINIRTWQYRSESEYDDDICPEIKALTLIRSFVNCVGIRPLLLFASDIGISSDVRSKKGALWDHPELRKLPNLTFEIECELNHTRLIAVVDLARFRFESDANALLNWGQGFIFLSTCELEEGLFLAKLWASKDRKGVFAFDYDLAAVTLGHNQECGILRYLPPNGSRRETIVVVGHEYLVSKKATECIESII